MKRMLAILMALTLLFVLTACGSGMDDTAHSSLDDVSSTFIFDDESDNSTEFNSDEVLSNVTSNDDWRDFLKEYEEWVDKYIAVVKKYNANPTDLSILSEYTSLVTELADWTERADDVSDSIEDIEDAAEYSAELMRIAAKLADAAGDL